MTALPAGLPDDFAARLVLGSADAIIYADAQGRMRFWNAAATRGFPMETGFYLGYGGAR